MKEFFITLYSNPNFPVYLGAVIIVLVITFFIVFFMGKRDKANIEKTQRLEAINADAFKETTVPVQMNVVTEEQRNQDLVQSTNYSQTPVQPVVTPEPVIAPAPVIEPEPVVTPQPVVMPEPIQPVVEPQPIVAPAPVIEPQPVVMPEPVVQPEPIAQPQPVVEPEPIVAPAPVIEPQPAVMPEPVVQAPVQPEPVQSYDSIYPTLDNNYDNLDAKVDNQIDNLQNIANSISSELNTLEQEQDRYRSMASAPTPLAQPEPVVEQQPVIMPEPVVQTPVQPEPIRNTNNLFSSVYAPQRSESSDDEVELPRLK